MQPRRQRTVLPVQGLWSHAATETLLQHTHSPWHRSVYTRIGAQHLIACCMLQVHVHAAVCPHGVVVWQAVQSCVELCMEISLTNANFLCTATAYGSRLMPNQSHDMASAAAVGCNCS